MTISLNQQLDEINACARDLKPGPKVKEPKSVKEYRLKRLEAIAATLRSLQDGDAPE